ncbi:MULTISPECIES: hypothetical protein [unclassified Anabaena]|uniref:hypothetical protein n=1 Tax=unclassified Anabaena TaxID=2619674 RepID=UPI000A5E3BBB|nr:MULTISPECIES: hypothetical protein [unclassified Anabaena]
MGLTLNLPPELEQYLTQEAQQQGVSVETYRLQLLQKCLLELDKNSNIEGIPT